MQSIELERAPQTLAAWSRAALRVESRSASLAPARADGRGDEAGDARTTRVDDLLFGATAIVGGPILVVAALLLS